MTSTGDVTNTSPTGKCLPNPARSPTSSETKVTVEGFEDVKHFYKKGTGDGWTDEKLKTTDKMGGNMREDDEGELSVLEGREGWGRASAKKVLEAIEKAKHVTLGR